VDETASTGDGNIKDQGNGQRAKGLDEECFHEEMIQEERCAESAEW
jgi:hypothetical protein